jgi:regulator of cell morphogenesis and NO signaling
MSINETATVADIAAEYPAAVRIFQRYGIDFCCGGKRAFREACEEQGLSFNEVEKAIVSAIELPEESRDWMHAPLHQLTEHIVSTYHDALREQLPRLEQMAAKAAQAHGGKSRDLVRIKDAVGELAAELTQHMWKEEMILFRAIRAIEAGAVSAGMGISAPITVMEQEHDHAGRLLAELRELTDDYVVPAWGCATMRALYQGLAELEASMHVHVHLENNILFPRALQLAAASSV